MDNDQWNFVEINPGLSFDWWWQNITSQPLNENDREELENEISDEVIQRVAWAHALQSKRGEIPVFVLKSEQAVRVYRWSLEHARTRKNIAIVLYHLDGERRLSSLQWGRRSVFDASKPHEFPESVRRLLLNGKFRDKSSTLEKKDSFKRSRAILSDTDTDEDTSGPQLRKRPDSNRVPKLNLDDPRYNLPGTPTDSDRSDSTESTLLSSNESEEGDVTENNEEYDEYDGDEERASWDLHAMFQPFLISSYFTLRKLFPKRLYLFTSNVVLAILLRWQGKQPWNAYLRGRIDERLRDEPDFETNMNTVQEIWRSIDRDRILAQADQGDVSDEEEDEETLQTNDRWEQVYEVVTSKYGVDPGNVMRMLQFFDQFINDTYPIPNGVDITADFQNARLVNFLSQEGLTTARQIANYFKTQVVPYMEEHYNQAVIRYSDTSAEENQKPYTGKPKYTTRDLILRKPPKTVRNRFKGKESMADVLGTKDTTGNPSLTFLEARQRLGPDVASEQLFNRLTNTQRAVVGNVISSYGQLVVAYTGFGKSLCMLMVAATFLANDKPVIIAVKRSTLDKFQADIREYFSGEMMNRLLGTLVTHFQLQNGNGLDGANVEKAARDIDSTNVHNADDIQLKIEADIEEDETTDATILNVKGAILLIDECQLYATGQFTSAYDQKAKRRLYQSMTTYKVMLQCAVASRVYLFTATPCRNDGNDLLSLLCMVKRTAPTPKQFNAMSPLVKYGFTNDVPTVDQDEDELRFRTPEIKKIRGLNPIGINWKCLVTSVRSEDEAKNRVGFAKMKTSIERVIMTDEEIARYNETEKKGWGPWGRNLQKVSDTDSKLTRALNLIKEHLLKFEEAQYKQVREKIKPRVLIYVELKENATRVLEALKTYLKSVKSVYIQAGEFRRGKRDYDAFEDVRSNTKICIVTEAGITGFDPPALTLVIAMNSFWSPSSKLQLEGRLVRRNKHIEFFKANLPTTFRVITLQAVRTTKLDRSLMLEFSNITRADQLELIKNGRNYTYDERQQALILKKAGWIKAAVDELHNVSLLYNECERDFERRSSISRPIVTSQGVFLSNYRPARRVSAPEEDIEALERIEAYLTRRVRSAPASLQTLRLKLTAPASAPVVIELVDGMQTIINPKTNRRVGINTRIFRELIRDNVIVIIDKRTL